MQSAASAGVGSADQGTSTITAPTVPTKTIPTKSPTPKPWVKNAITKQRMPTYTQSTLPVDDAKAIPETPLTYINQRVPDVPLNRPISPTNDQGLMTNDSSITKQHMPTYSNSSDLKDDHTPAITPLEDRTE